ncbi:hypothetical protein [Pseudonocardia lacus]|uniref:hypothetical protein n=1 Tax=Pseudonocardia lacus TaxID=2835865 RepID=UPI001BDCA537|nr:hypothetical protein [Pseudonocardia lacus]
MNDRLEIVRFTGGEHDGLVVEAPPHVAERLHATRFEVLATGRLYDLTDQCRIPGARAITPPTAPATTKPAAEPMPAAVIPSPTPSPEQPATSVAEPVAPADVPLREPAPAAQRRAVPAVPTMPVFQPGRPTG